MTLEVPISLLAAVEEGRWAPGLGDPTPLGWATVVGYLAAATLCLLWTKPPGSGRLLPSMLAGVMTLLAVNKQLDLQSLLTEIGRDAAKEQGWYDDRQTFQTILIAAIAGVASLGLAVLLWMLRRRWRESLLAIAGVAFLLGFVVVRAASFHNVDQGLGESWVGLRLNWILELGGIALVAVGAIVGWRVRRANSLERPVHSTDAKADLPSAKHELPATGEVVAAASARAKAARGAGAIELEGFVVQPIRISQGPPARRIDPVRSEQPPTVS